MQVHLLHALVPISGFTSDSTGAILHADPGDWKPFKAVDMTRGLPIPGVEAGACLEDIAVHGFHVTNAHVRTTDKFV